MALFTSEVDKEVEKYPSTYLNSLIRGLIKQHKGDKDYTIKLLLFTLDYETKRGGKE